MDVAMAVVVTSVVVGETGVHDNGNPETSQDRGAPPPGTGCLPVVVVVTILEESHVRMSRVRVTETRHYNQIRLWQKNKHACGQQGSAREHWKQHLRPEHTGLLAWIEAWAKLANEPHCRNDDHTD